MCLLLIDLAALLDPQLPEFPLPGLATSLNLLERSGYTIAYITSQFEHKRAEVQFWLALHDFRPRYAQRPLHLREDIYRSMRLVHWKMQKVQYVSLQYVHMQSSSFYYIDPDEASRRAVSVYVSGAIALADLLSFLPSLS